MRRRIADAAAVAFNGEYRVACVGEGEREGSYAAVQVGHHGVVFKLEPFEGERDELLCLGGVDLEELTGRLPLNSVSQTRSVQYPLPPSTSTPFSLRALPLSLVMTRTMLVALTACESVFATAVRGNDPCVRPQGYFEIVSPNRPANSDTIDSQVARIR